MALEGKVPVIPVAMIGTDKVQPIGKRIPRIGRVGIRIGKPLDFSRYEGMEGDRFVLRSITDEIMYELMDLSGQEYVDVYAAKAKADLAAAGVPPRRCRRGRRHRRRRPRCARVSRRLSHRLELRPWPRPWRALRRPASGGERVLVAVGPAGSKRRSRAQVERSSSVEDHTPVPSPARNAAPRPVVSRTAGRSTGTPSWSACSSQSRSFAAAPPSTASRGRSTPASPVIRSHDVPDLEGDRLEGRPYDVRPRRRPGQPDDQPSGGRVPVRRAEAGQRGDEHHAARVRNRAGEVLGLAGGRR